MPDDVLFVYGTLRRGGGAPLLDELAHRARWLGHGSIPGVLYDAGDYPAAVPSEGAADRVRGEAWQLDDAALWHALDAWEGCDAGDPLPHEYVRRVVPVMLDDGRRLDAWVYFYNRSVATLRPIPSGDWFAGRTVS